MTEEEEIRQVLYDFEDAGLVSKNITKVIDCISDNILGIGIGEQGIVTSKEEIKGVFEAGIKVDDSCFHSIRYGRTEILLHSKVFATICAEVCVISTKKENGKTSESRFQQLLTVQKVDGSWKICALHASTPVVTEETMEAYPLKFAEKTLQSLREKIGEKAYMAEEQYRRAILSDTIAFYIINFTKDEFEKCQCNGDLCVAVEPGAPYEKLILDNAPDYIFDDDKKNFFLQFCKENIYRMFENGEKELSYEYKMKVKNGGGIWAVTTVRLITDVETGDQKGIMYVRNIDQEKKEALALVNKAACDGMTKLLNKEAMIQAVDDKMKIHRQSSGVFIMFDVDNFKYINDTFGHPVGDEVLIRIADILREYFREEDHLGRLGGDEFGVFSTWLTEKEQVRRQLLRIAEKIKVIRICNCRITVSCSFGVAGCRMSASFEELYKKADSALYQSKRNGKNQISFFCDNEGIQREY